MLIQRQKDIIHLLKQYDILSSQRLAELLHVSSKTIRNDINHINSLYTKNYIISIKGSGYSLIKDFPFNETEDYQDIIQQNIQFSILKRLLDTPKMNFYELADQLYMSEALLQKNIHSLNIIIQKRNPHVHIRREKNMLYINGNEEEKRQITTYFLINELNQYNLNITQYQSFVAGVDIQQLQEYVIQFNQEHHLNLRDLEILSLVVHVSLMLERILQGNKIMDDTQFIQYDYDELAVLFCQGLKQWYMIDFNEREINYISTLFAGKIPLIESDIINEMKIFIDHIILEINDIYEINLSLDEKFKDNILIHLLGLKTRIENHTFLNNPLMNDIKKNYPIVYDISVFIAMKIEEQFHTQLYEEEIGYITFHLMGSIKRLHASSYKKIVILYPFGRAGLDYLQRKLTYIHDLNIEICDILSIFDYEKVKQYQPDLILSFFHIQEPLDFPVYVCHHMLDDTDIEDIYRMLKKNKSLQSSRIFFEKELFFQGIFQTKEEVIHFLCQKLLAKGYVNHHYENLVLTRERIAPTAYGNFFAIPHAVKKEAFVNKIAVCLLDKPILWNEENVRLVFLFCLSKERNQEFEELFERLVKLLDEQAKVNKLLKSKNYEEFIESFFKE